VRVDVEQVPNVNGAHFGAEREAWAEERDLAESFVQANAEKGQLPTRSPVSIPAYVRVRAQLDRKQDQIRRGRIRSRGASSCGHIRCCRASGGPAA
jgi:hypothetical protein